MVDRIACINPNCRRTAARDRHPGSTWIICAKCWRAIPNRLRLRWKQLKARWKKLERTMRKRGTDAATWNRIVDRIDDAWNRLTGDIIRYFTNPEAAPAGLDNFLKEIGLVQ